MKINIINNCTKTYRPDHIKIINKILNRIPEKYLAGLAEIRFWDKSNDPIAKQVSDDKHMSSTFDIYMGGFSRKSTFSIYHFNIVFINLVVDHVVDVLQSRSNDKDILAVRKNRIFSFGWMWLVYWQPIIYIFMFGNYLYSRVAFIKKFIDHRIKILLRDTKSNS
jgi:hypothetical protein